MADDGLLTYFAKFGLDASEFLGGLEKSSGGILKFYRDVSVSLGATMFVFDKLMAYGQQFIQLANQASQFISTIDKLSVTTGMTNEELQRMSNVARYADSDISSLATMVNKLQLNLRDQGEQGEKARKVLDAMGVSYRNADGSLKSATEIFPQMIDGLGKLSSSADRVTASNILVGKGYQELSGYIALGKDGIEQYYNTANTLTDEQQRKLREYEGACKDLDATLQNINYTVGSELAPSFSEWTDLMNDVAGSTEIEEFFGTLNDFLTLSARGFHIMGAEAEVAWKLVHGDVAGASESQRDLYAWIASKQREDALDASGYSEGMIWDATAGKWVKPTSGSKGSSLPADLGSSSSKTGLDAFQIRDMQLDYEKMSKITIPGQQKELKDLQKQYREMGDRGSDAAKKIKTQIDELTISIQKNQNQLAEWESKLTGEGAAITAAGGPTYNSMFASSLQTGGLGPDWAGYSDLAGMSEAELQEIAKGGLGKSKGMAEKAQQYLSMMKSGKVPGAGTASATGKATATPGSADQTADLKGNLSTQKDLWTDLFDHVKTGWEGVGISHLKTSEMMNLTSLIRSQAELDYMAACINFAGENPIIQNKVIMSADGPDWTPPTFTPVEAPTLAAADFSSVQFSGSNKKSGGSENGQAKVDVTLNVKNEQGISTKLVSATNESLGTTAITRGM